MVTRFKGLALQDHNNDSRFYSSDYRGKTYYETAGLNPYHFILTAEAGRNIFNYLKSLNLSKGADFLVLSQDRHIYYEKDELKNYKTIINLNRLNQVEDLNALFETLYMVLPSDTNFIGCFYEGKQLHQPSFISGLYSRILALTGLSPVIPLGRKEIEKVLVRNGFRPVDFREINGLTYFCSRTISRQAQIVA